VELHKDVYKDYHNHQYLVGLLPLQQLVAGAHVFYVTKTRIAAPIKYLAVITCTFVQIHQSQKTKIRFVFLCSQGGMPIIIIHGSLGAVWQLWPRRVCLCGCSWSQEHIFSRCMPNLITSAPSAFKVFCFSKLLWREIHVKTGEN
jgi:hypothetical protein